MTENPEGPHASGIFLLMLVLADTCIISDAFIKNEHISWTLYCTLPLLVGALIDLRQKSRTVEK